MWCGSSIPFGCVAPHSLEVGLDTALFSQGCRLTARTIWDKSSKLHIHPSLQGRTDRERRPGHW